MPPSPIRFVHAGDFHLERVAGGVTDVPEHLAELFIEAPYTATQRVFDTALNEDADFLVLSGDLFHPQRTGPRGPLFLIEQMARLAEREIPVYWAGGGIDPPEVWPRSLRLPENVHRFPVGRVESYLVERDGSPVARVSGISRDRHHTIRAAEFRRDTPDLFHVAVVHGAAEPDALRDHGVDYWALGGRHDRSTLISDSPVAHWAGSPQGRSPREVGPHGCTLVTVDTDGHARTSLRTTDAARWIDERIVVDEATGREGLQTLLRERMHTLVDTTPDMDLLITWTVAGTGRLLGELRRGPLADELLQWLRREYGYGPPAAWSLSFGLEPSAAVPAHWYDQETLAGDYLRSLRQLEIDTETPLDLFGPEHDAAELPPTLATLQSRLEIHEKPERRRLLREAALLGADLLGAEEPES
jgi:DNA repair exonuclease SbcCD nuclease subunit